MPESGTPTQPDERLALRHHEWIDHTCYDAICQVVRRIAHSLNNHVVIVQTLSGLLHPSIPQETEAQEDFVLLTQAHEKLHAMIRRLLLFSRGDKRPLASAIQLQPLLQAKADILQKTLPSNIQLVLQWDAKDDVVCISEEKISTILQELSNNAIEAMPEGGTLRLCSQQHYIDPEESALRKINEGHYFVLSVQDSGTQSVLTPITSWFEPLLSTKPNHDGFGMAEVFGIVRGIQGTLRVHNVRDVGSSVAVYLPSRQSPKVP